MWSEVLGRQARFERLALITVLIGLVGGLLAPVATAAPSVLLPSAKETTLYARGSATPGTLDADPTAGTKGQVDLIAGPVQVANAPRTVVSFVAADPLPASRFFNLTNPIEASIGLKWVVSSQGQGVKGSLWLRVELFEGSVRLGGADVAAQEATVATVTTRSLTASFFAEMPSIHAGARPELRVTLLEATVSSPVKILAGTEGESTIRYTYFDYDPLTLPLYSEAGVLTILQGQQGEASDAESGAANPPSGGAALLVPVGAGLAVSALARSQKRGRTGLVLALLLAAPLAGCFGKGGKGTDATGTDTPYRPTVSTGGPVIIQDNCVEGIFDVTGEVRGFVIDRNRANLPLRGAKVFLAQTSYRTVTDAHGYYRLYNITPYDGYRLGVDAGNEFQTLDPVILNVPKCSTQTVNISMVRKLPCAPGPDQACGPSRAHTHPSWPTDPQLVFDADLTVRIVCRGGTGTLIGACPTGASYESETFGLPTKPQLKLVQPGAARIEITLTPSGGPSVPEFGLRIQPTKGHPPVNLVPRPPVEKFSMAFFPVLADSGHDPVSGWTFQIVVPNYALTSGGAAGRDATPPEDFLSRWMDFQSPATVRAVINIFKGVEPLEPPHASSWTNTTLPLVRGNPGSHGNCLTPKRTYQQLYVETASSVDPPLSWNGNRFGKAVLQGTKEIVGEFYGHSDREFVYRVRPDTAWTVPDTEAATNGTYFTFSIPVADDQWDGLYIDPGKVSRWEFGYRLGPANRVDPMGAGASGIASGDVCLYAEIIQDPEWNVGMVT